MNEKVVGDDGKDDDDVNDKFVTNENMNNNVVEDDVNVEVKDGGVHDEVFIMIHMKQ